MNLSDELQLNLPARKTKIPGSRGKLFYSKYGRECITCKKFKRWENFSKHKKGFNGKRNDCKECSCERVKQYNAENRGSRSEYNKQWHLRNREARSKYYAEYLRTPGGRLVSRRRNYKRRARLRTAKTEYYSYLEQLTKFAYVNILLLGDRENKIARCPYCKRDLKLSDTTLDHFIPISRNGNDTLSNIIHCCGSCNSSKRDKIPHIFLRNTKLTLGEQSVIKSCAKDSWVTDSLQYVELLNEIVEDLEDGFYD